MNCRIINFGVHVDSRGSLVSLEGNKNIPFEIKRVYYIYDAKTDMERGKHAHRELEQLIVCLNGSCVFVLDDGKVRESVELDSPNLGLYIGKNTWREIRDFSKDCILMVLANKYYDENEYIRDYNEFLGISLNNVGVQ